MDILPILCIGGATLFGLPIVILSLIGLFK
jgi:hypothetical protein